MNKRIKRAVSVFAAAIMLFVMLASAPAAAEKVIACRLDKERCAQGDTVTAQVYFPAAYDKVAALDFSLLYDAKDFNVVSVNKTDDFRNAYNAQVNGRVFSENHKTDGVIHWGVAGANNYNFSGVFAEIVFKVERDADEGISKMTLNINSAVSSGYVDLTSDVTTSGAAVYISRNLENDMKFVLNSDRTGYVLKDYTYKMSDSVIVPSEYMGLPVTGIGSSAFYHHDEIKSIFLPDGLKSIGVQAFSGCIKLESIDIPDSVTTIEREAFSECTGLKTVDFPATLNMLGEKAFEGCMSLEAAELPFTLETLGYRAFEKCASLRSVKISKNTDIGMNAFINCADDLSFTIVSANLRLPAYLTLNNMKSEKHIVKDLSALCTCTIGNQTFDGKPSKPTAEVKLKLGGKLEEGVDYVVYYADNTKPGTATAYVSGIGEYGEGLAVKYNIVCEHKKLTDAGSKAPTCTQDGYSKQKCELCGEIITKTIPATGHNPGDWIIDKMPTVYAAGSKHRVCKTCGRTVDAGTVMQKVYPDVNLDGNINSSDALSILRYSTGITEDISTEQALYNADCNGDKLINSIDALIVLQISIGTIVL